MRVIFGGHWEQPPDGWLVLTQQEQDIRRPLRFADNSVEGIFSEHVLEHVSLLDGVFFLRECFRVLQPAGAMRLVCPTVDRLQEFAWHPGRAEENELERVYLEQSVLPLYQPEVALLRSLNITPSIRDIGVAFMFDSLMKKHEHVFLWSENMLSRVLRQLGFLVVFQVPGKGLWALERKFRGVPEEEARAADMAAFDPESSALVATKPV
jgi:ubiquinone/menaquinone biosynthesis C-methylase UbiE